MKKFLVLITVVFASSCTNEVEKVKEQQKQTPKSIIEASKNVRIEGSKVSGKISNEILTKMLKSDSLEVSNIGEYLYLKLKQRGSAKKAFSNPSARRRDPVVDKRAISLFAYISAAGDIDYSYQDVYGDDVNQFLISSATIRGSAPVGSIYHSLVHGVSNNGYPGIPNTENYVYKEVHKTLNNSYSCGGDDHKVRATAIWYGHSNHVAETYGSFGCD